MLSRTLSRNVLTRAAAVRSSTCIGAKSVQYQPQQQHGNFLAFVPSPVNFTATRAYHPRVIDHYQNPRNVGSLEKNDPAVGTGLVGAPACGDVMRLQIKVNDDTGLIEDVKFKTFGCGSAIASSSFATELLKGKSLDEALKIKNTIIAKELSLPPVKLHCSMLAEDAIKSAVKDYRSKRGKKRPTLGPDAVKPTAGLEISA